MTPLMKNQKVSSARRRIESKYGPRIDPGLHFGWIKDYRDENPPVVVYARVSTGPQETRGTLELRVKHLKAELRKLGFTVVGCVSETMNAKTSQRPQLAHACDIAMKHGGIVVAHSWERFIRPNDWDKLNRDAWPLMTQWKQLKAQLAPVDLVTLWIADYSDRGIKKLEKQIRKPGRKPRKTPGSKKRLRMQHIAKARQLNSEGLSYRQIGHELGVAHSTIQGWLKA